MHRFLCESFILFLRIIPAYQLCPLVAHCRDIVARILCVSLESSVARTGLDMSLNISCIMLRLSTACIKKNFMHESSSNNPCKFWPFDKNNGGKKMSRHQASSVWITASFKLATRQQLPQQSDISFLYCTFFRNNRDCPRHLFWKEEQGQIAEALNSLVQNTSLCSQLAKLKCRFFLKELGGRNWKFWEFKSTVEVCLFCTHGFIKLFFGGVGVEKVKVAPRI